MAKPGPKPGTRRADPDELIREPLPDGVVRVAIKRTRGHRKALGNGTCELEECLAGCYLQGAKDVMEYSGLLDGRLKPAWRPPAELMEGDGI